MKHHENYLQSESGYIYIYIIHGWNNISIIKPFLLVLEISPSSHGSRRPGLYVEGPFVPRSALSGAADAPTVPPKVCRCKQHQNSGIWPSKPWIIDKLYGFYMICCSMDCICYISLYFINYRWSANGLWMDTLRFLAKTWDLTFQTLKPKSFTLW